MNAATDGGILSAGSTGKKNIYLRRRVSGILGWTLTTFAFSLLAFALLYLLGFVLFHGADALHMDILLTDTQGVAGGLRNAIVGSLLISGMGVILAAPVGVSAGIYLAEYGDGWLGRTGRFMSDVLVGIPSIVLGYFGYITMVLYLGWQFSLAAGALTLSIMMLPYIARTTEMAFRQLPSATREAAFGLGCSEGRVIWSILLPAARGPVITGVLLALAIALGETAPLLYTAGWSNYLWSGHFTHEGVGYLTYVIWSFIGEPYTSAHQLAYAAALLVTLMILAINLIARLLFYRRP